MLADLLVVYDPEFLSVMCCNVYSQYCGAFQGVYTQKMNSSGPNTCSVSRIRIPNGILADLECDKATYPVVHPDCRLHTFPQPNHVKRVAGRIVSDSR